VELKYVKNKSLINYWQNAISGDISEKDLLFQIKNYYPPLTSVAFTRECMLRCRHCVYPPANSSDIKLNNLKRIDRIIAATFKAGSRDLIHIGRTLKKEHLPILKKYQDRGMSLNLIDNGSGVRLIKEIKKSGVFFDGGIDISIDGNKQSHEAQRGSGAWQLALDGIEKLKEVAGHISVTGTASSLNYDTIVDGLLLVKKKYPFIRLIQVTTTSPAKFQTERMNLKPNEMRKLFGQLLAISHLFPPKLLIYQNNDIEAILEKLSRYDYPKTKYIHMEWKINNLIVAYFPESIVTAEEFGIDANGRHVLPFGLDYHLNERPEKWEMRDDLITSNPDRSYELLVDKFFKTYGQKKLQQEKKIFKKFLANYFTNNKE
jgi:MoaA/NifB/PqqE/SkfB family radical SAM enzyme